MQESNPKSQNRERLVVEDLRKSFLGPSGATLEVLRGVAFQCEPGEIVAIMGASGAGKSTLLHTLGALEPGDSGLIKLGDFEISSARPARLARYRNQEVGFVFQFHHLLTDLTAVENVALPLSISREGWRESLRSASQALENVGLAARAMHPVGHLSGGEQQRVALARALIKSPHLVLADEPTGNLDAPTGDEIGELLSEYRRERGAIVVIATHNARLAAICDRTLFLEDGKLSR